MPNISRQREDARTPGDDNIRVDLTRGSRTVNLGGGDDTVRITGGGFDQVRLTFTSSEVGNGAARDSNTMANQDGGFAVRAQVEGAGDLPTGAISRFDDEGISFIAAGNFTFDVRDLVSGTARGDGFNVVRLGTSGADTYDEGGSGLNYYINGGAGNDTISGGRGADFLVGGAGDDNLAGGLGPDSFIGGAGADVIRGGRGNDTVIMNVSTDGADRVVLGSGNDIATLSAAAGVAQIRLTFTSAEVGNGSFNDSGTMANQDGGFAVRVAAEDASGGIAGDVSRFDDEGITFVASGAVTFDIRDLVAGTQRGDAFKIAQLGSERNDNMDHSAAIGAVYVNAGLGDDTAIGSMAGDFLVGGAGNDRLFGRAGNDSFIGGAGDDMINGGGGDDTVIVDVATAGADSVNLRGGMDIVQVSSTAAVQAVRLTFTSAEVGNGNALDAGSMANQDGGLAVRMQGEGILDLLTGAVGRYDDEGISFVGNGGVQFDVRDLVSGTQRGDMFDVVTLGTKFADTIDGSGEALTYYVNGGAGNDDISSGSADDFLVGGVGDDVLNGGMGDDQLLGGTGADTFVFEGAAGDDIVLDFVSGTDTIDLSDYDLTFADLTIEQSGGNTVITADGIDDLSITLTAVAQVVAGDFAF
jgi:Ca2+-binding RTX toxin-like protein